MNTKSILVTGAISLAVVSLGNAADKYVYMSGSTAARSQVFLTINTAGAVFDAAPTVVSQGNATPGKSGYMTFTGHLIGDPAGVTTSIKCHWSGSEAGIADLVGGSQQFLADGAVSDTSTPGPFTTSPVDLAMADNDKAYSKNPSVAITGTFVGAIPFAWVAEKGSNPSITNVTDAQVRVLLGSPVGSPAALLTGNPADIEYVYVTGRNSFSGTRVNSYGIPGYGIFSSGHQIEVNTDGSMVDQGGGVYIGDYGYESGGDVAKQMGYDLSVASSVDLIQGGGHFSVIAYLGISDANSAVANGGKMLSLNGMIESTAGVREGQYSFWGKEYVYRKNIVSSQATTVYNALADPSTGITAHADNVALIDKSTMHADRNGPTSDPIHY